MALKLRQPIVAVLGHVDHGKTTLLDAIRKTRVQIKEAGGITQSIGASEVTTKSGKKITFIDTPGHSAFEQMRSKGAWASDIALLVVAADDGVKPQTKEAINHIRMADIPFIVVLTKTDLPSAGIEGALASVEKEGVLFEGRGGQVPWVKVSAKKEEGIDELLDTIVLLSEVSDIKGDENAPLKASVIETGKDKRGPFVSMVIKNGTIKVGDEINAPGTNAKVRGIFDCGGKSIQKAVCGEGAQILGFSSLPKVGSVIDFGRVSKEEVGQKKDEKRQKIDSDSLPVLIKAQSTLSLEALENSLPKEAVIVGRGVGDITESDIFTAKSSQKKVLVLGFGVSLPQGVKKLSEMEGVEIFVSNIIYRLVEKLEDMAQKKKILILGQAQIIAKFPFNGSLVAGSKMLSGKISKKDNLELKRDDKTLGEVKATSLRKGKEEVDQVEQAEEFGILFYPQLDFEVGDMLISHA